jgi:hypothetical protein
MTSYEIVVKEVEVIGLGRYEFELSETLEGPTIKGTHRVIDMFVKSNPLKKCVLFHFDPPILIPQNLYLRFRSIEAPDGVILAGIEPFIGESLSTFWAREFDGQWSEASLSQGVHGAFNLAITCAGELPSGACCDMALPECQGGEDAGKRCFSNANCVDGTCESVCREVPQMNCPWPPKTDPPLGPAWVEGGLCEPDPFELACGLAACCLRMIPAKT